MSDDAVGDAMATRRTRQGRAAAGSPPRGTARGGGPAANGAREELKSAFGTAVAETPRVRADDALASDAAATAGSRR